MNVNILRATTYPVETNNANPCSVGVQVSDSTLHIFIDTDLSLESRSKQDPKRYSLDGRWAKSSMDFREIKLCFTQVTTRDFFVILWLI